MIEICSKDGCGKKALEHVTVGPPYCETHLPQEQQEFWERVKIARAKLRELFPVIKKHQ
jgi:hypothetical protein